MTTVANATELGHTAIFENSARTIRTTLVDTDYDATKFLKTALSDHKGLYSVITT